MWETWVIVEILVELQMFRKNDVQAESKGSQANMHSSWAIGKGRHVWEVVEHAILGDVLWEVLQDGVRLGEVQ